MASITVSGGGGFTKSIAALGNMSPPFRAIGEVLKTMIDDSFAAQSNPWGGAWRQWSPATIELYNRGGLFKKMRAVPEKILQNTGTLRNSVIPFSDAHSAHVGVGGAAFNYAKVQQFGNPANLLPNRQGGAPAPIPARPYMPITRTGRVRLPSDTIEEIKMLLAMHITQKGR